MLTSNGFARMRLLAFLLALLVMLAAAAAMAADKSADKGHWKNVHLVYTTDIKGKIEPCG